MTEFSDFFFLINRSIIFTRELLEKFLSLVLVSNLCIEEIVKSYNFFSSLLFSKIQFCTVFSTSWHISVNDLTMGSHSNYYVVLKESSNRKILVQLAFKKKKINTTSYFFYFLFMSVKISLNGT